MPEFHKDFYRDTWVRYLGYANEVGEAFWPLVPAKVVRWSYGVAFGYVLADTADKSWKAYRTDGRMKKIGVETGDALIWQTLASVIIPGFTINRISAFTGHMLNKHAPSVPPLPRCLLTVGIGLAAIPIIIHPIDAGVTMLMDRTYRQWIKV